MALAVIVENAGWGSESAAPIARRVFDYLLLGLYPSEEDLDLVREGKVRVSGTCNGSGTVHMRQGFFSIQQTCPHCHGSGKIIPEPCTTCNGQGKLKKHKTLEVKIPAGIDDGMRIRSSGNGEPGRNGGPSGDLFIEIRIRKHDIFERDGDDLHCQVPVSMPTAALGGEIDVPTLTGKASIDIPEGTQSGKTFRLRGRGVKGVRSSYPGDLYCHIVVETPVKLTEHQRKLLKELDAEPRQVLIEAQLWETAKNPKSVKGIDWAGTFAAQHVSYGNGQLDPVEFGYLVSPMVKMANIILKFDETDINDDGFITEDELVDTDSPEV